MIFGGSQGGTFFGDLATLALPAAVARGRLHFVETDAEVTVRVGVRVGVGVRVRVRVGVRVRVRA